MRSAGHTAPEYVYFPTPLLPRPSWTQIFSSAPYSRTPSAYVSPLIVRDHVSRPYKTRGKIIFLSYILYLNLYIFGYKTGRQKILHRMIASIPLLQSVRNIFVNEIYIYLFLYIYLFINKHAYVLFIALHKYFRLPKQF
jgi:hypothetical protein